MGRLSTQLRSVWFRTTDMKLQLSCCKALMTCKALSSKLLGVDLHSASDMDSVLVTAITGHSSILQ